VAALVSGIAGVVVGVSPPVNVLSLRITVAVVSISGILAVSFGVVGLRRSRVRAAPDKGMAIAGVVLGTVIFLMLVGLAVLLDANRTSRSSTPSRARTSRAQATRPSSGCLPAGRPAIGGWTRRTGP
jgi:hypothetical protein